MPEPYRPARVASFKTAADFRAHCAGLGIDLPCDDSIAAESPLALPCGVTINGRQPGNRIAIHPMEGWDGTTTGGVSDEMRQIGRAHV